MEVARTVVLRTLLDRGSLSALELWLALPEHLQNRQGWTDVLHVVRNLPGEMDDGRGGRYFFSRGAAGRLSFVWEAGRL